MEVETLEAILQVAYNFKMDWSHFLNYIIEKKYVIKFAAANEKYIKA